MSSETGKIYINHLLASALSALKLAPYLEKIEIAVPDSKFGDYSSNLALILAKQAKVNPKELAEKIAEQVKFLDVEKLLTEVTVVGGFINFRFSEKFLVKNVRTILEQKELFGAGVSGNGQTVVVEYFQNNVAKPPHVGHLRSAVIGDCLLRVLRSQGYKAISDTHIGDWGVQFGILIYAYKIMGDKAIIEKDPINELNKLYVAMSAKIEAEADLREKGKEEFIKLEKGDTENRELWKWFVRVSLEDFENYRKLLGVLNFDYNLGESFYEDKMPKVLEEFKSKNLVKIGETGEQYVDLEEFGLGRCILVKSDSGTTYHMRDFATYIYRRKEFNFARNIYVVDNRQSHHFKQLFKALELAGYPTSKDSLHVDFGFMSLPEGAISTRKGTTISLQNLIGEANKRALEIIEQKNPSLENKKYISEQIALAAIKYFDLSHNRKTEIVFEWDKALSFEGNTGPYLQYTHARIHGILRKAITSPNPSSAQEGNVSGVIPLLSKESLGEVELAVLRKLLYFPEVTLQVSQDLLPNLLCNYLFELAQSFNTFYQEIPVLAETDVNKKEFRLGLISAVVQVLSNGLYLLGIEAPEEM